MKPSKVIVSARDAKRARLEQVRGWLAARLEKDGRIRPSSWGTPALIRFVLILTYDGSVDLLMHHSGKDLRTGQLELAVKAVVPGVRIGWGHNYLRFILPDTPPTRSELLLVDEPILCTREGPAATGDQAFFTRTFASIWLEAIDATDPFNGCAFPPASFCPSLQTDHALLRVRALWQARARALPAPRPLSRVLQPALPPGPPARSRAAGPGGAVRPLLHGFLT